jgi:outer membrane protein OmpA-like peptidoglycan-associated protein
MSKPSCKCKETECEECPEWIFTLADLIMCMMGLFVILWVLKPGPKQDMTVIDGDWIKQVAAIRDAFGYIPDPASKDPVDMHMLMKKLESLDPLKGPGDGGRKPLPRKSPAGIDEESQTIRPGKQSAVGGKLLFCPGKADLTPQTSALLDEVAELIRGHRNIVLIKGHASFDDFADGSTPQQRMDLSLRRAQTVADYLTAQRVEPEILRVQGCSTFEPVSRGTYTEDAQARNRRVEVEATDTLVEERQERTRPFAAAPSAATPAAASSPRAPAPHQTVE